MSLQEILKTSRALKFPQLHRIVSSKNQERIFYQNSNVRTGTLKSDITVETTTQRAAKA